MVTLKNCKQAGQNDYEGLSTDNKPTDCAVNSTFEEFDTGDTYYFTGETWVKKAGSGGGGGGGGETSIICEIVSGSMTENSNYENYDFDDVVDALYNYQFVYKSTAVIWGAGSYDFCERASYVMVVSSESVQAYAQSAGKTVTIEDYNTGDSYSGDMIVGTDLFSVDFSQGGNLSNILYGKDAETGELIYLYSNVSTGDAD